jgi:hypothetical protein
MNLPSIRKNTQRKPVLPPSPTLQTVYFDAIPRLLIPLIVQPGAAPKYRQPDPDRTPAIELVERTQLAELTFQRSQIKRPLKFKPQQPHAAHKPLKMILPEPHPAPAKQHRFEKAVAIPETTVVNPQERYTLLPDFSIKIQEHKKFPITVAR